MQAENVYQHCDPRGYPDWTLPISIIAQIIDKLKVDIVAQTLTELKVDITAQSLPQLNVNIAQSAVTLNVNIASITSGVVFNVAQSGTWTVNAAQTGTWTINIGAPLDAAGNLKTSIQSSVTLNVNIAGSAVKLNVNIDSITSGVVFNVAQSGTWTINAVQSGTWTINIGAPLDADGNLKASIKSSVTLNINIASISEGVTFNVYITGSTTLNVAVTSSVDINIKTSSGANIVIDKLTQEAYTERTALLTNRGTTPSTTVNNYTYMRGKFFPRGCRGFIRIIRIYCNNNDTVNHTFTIKVSPQPGIGPIITRTLTVMAGAGWAWRGVAVNAFWNYDSMFICVRSDSDSYGGLAYDIDEPYDYYYSTDEAAWSHAPYRYWFEVILDGATVGDLPISGTVNTVEIPAVANLHAAEMITVPANTEVTIKTVEGAGRLVYTCFYTNNPNVLLYFYCDGALALQLQPNAMYFWGYTANSPGKQLLKYDTANNIYRVASTIPLVFRRQLRIIAYNPTGTTSNVDLGSTIIHLQT